MADTEQLKSLRTRLDAITKEVRNMRSAGAGDNILLFGFAIARANYWLAQEIALDKATAAEALRFHASEGNL